MPHTPLNPGTSDYVADAETITEMIRLLEQDVLVTRAVSGLLPPGVEPPQVHDVLDIGCGPGGWVLEMAKTSPTMQVTGIDISSLVIDFATQRALVEACANARFAVMDFQQLAFPDASFDLVNARLVQWFLPNDRRKQIVQEWYRVLRPGGVLRCLETELTPITNSEALERHGHLFLAALDRMRKMVSPGGYHAGIPLILRPLLTQLGCQDIRETAHLINFSAGMPDRDGVVQDIIRGMETMGQVMVRAKVVRKQELTRLQEQTLADIKAPGFWGMLFFVSCWGRKPQASVGEPQPEPG